jgi:ubiquinol-cytochrome c reductase iron-sulfur subunit
MTDDVDQKRRHFLTVATAVTGGVGIAFAVVPFVASLKPSARALALGAPVEVPVGSLEPGEMVRVMWRGRVVYVLRRDPAMLLGCAPLAQFQVDPEDDWFGGFFCPCHGSRFDLAGRVYKGVPAPTNMRVPPYRFIRDDIIMIGAESGAA